MTYRTPTQSSSTEEHDASENGSVDIFVARQPIFDRDLHVVGYELLFRDSDRDHADIPDGEQAANRATSQVMVTSLMELDLQRLVDGKMAYFNLTREFLIAGSNLPLDSTNIGIEVLETVEIDDELVEAIDQLAMLGFSIALDDFDWRPGVERLLRSADSVKIDVQAHDEQALVDMVDQLRAYDVTLVAERVETPDHFELCKSLGFDRFQGFFLCRPSTVTARRMPENRVNTMRLMARLQDPEITPEEVEEIIKNDVALTYRLLKTVNSAYYGLSVTIRSISHAIVYLGMPTVRNWANMLLLSGLADRPNELVRLALIRARMSELLMADKPRDTRDAAFTTGLFSMLDALLDMPMDEIMSNLPLDEDLQQALVERDGPFGRLLQTVIACERGDWNNIRSDLFSNEKLSAAYLAAVRWCHEQFTAMQAEA
jgi:EAL and modified HD-GYP domain-containing signal transduction protein